MGFFHFPLFLLGELIVYIYLLVQLATEEKYRACTSTMNSLFDWLTEMEKRLGMQESVRETLEEIRTQLTIVKVSL